MSKGDVLAELRAWRDEFARLNGYDIHAMAAAVRDFHCAGGRNVVHGEPRRPVTTRMPNQALQPTGAAIAVPGSSKVTEAAPAAEL